jgi:hypothetical protein
LLYLTYKGISDKDRSKATSIFTSTSTRVPTGTTKPKTNEVPMSQVEIEVIKQVEALKTKEEKKRQQELQEEQQRIELEVRRCLLFILTV